MKWLGKMMMLIFMLAVGVGCSADEEAKESKKEQVTEVKEDAPRTLEEVVKRASAEMAKLEGARYSVVGEQMFDVKVDEQQKKIKTMTDMKMNYTQNPLALSMKGEVSADEKKIPVEAYMVGGDVYQKQPEGKWMKMKGVGTESQAKAQTASDSLQHVQTILEEIQKEESEAITMEETDQHFIIDISLAGSEDQYMLDYFERQVVEMLGPQLRQAQLPVKDEEVKLEKVNERIYINKENLQQEKLDKTMEIEIKNKQIQLSGRQKMTITYEGEFVEEITVPQKVREATENK
ncbi:DUF6612 family protein [Mechercharimyces sp. CAU 1602]|uniref:DUF6612 family protein n=1 Tax=Mechercharimyces sp. CAU 1602 TaxID=2973933 RepID=UPI002162C783|nr:DUF6612 family protein [Mechercharimyces sp. CAU 1602]MCS1351952.1 hypothetical protein [Mechercharimyces sp. CAU 1602]